MSDRLTTVLPPVKIQLPNAHDTPALGPQAGRSPSTFQPQYRRTILKELTESIFKNNPYHVQFIGTIEHCVSRDEKGHEDHLQRLRSQTRTISRLSTERLGGSLGPVLEGGAGGLRRSALPGNGACVSGVLRHALHVRI